MLSCMVLGEGRSASSGWDYNTLQSDGSIQSLPMIFDRKSGKFLRR